MRTTGVRAFGGQAELEADIDHGPAGVDPAVQRGVACGHSGGRVGRDALLRVGSMLSVGSPAADVSDVAQPLDAGLLGQKLFTDVPLPGVTPAQVASPEMPRDTKIWNLAARRSAVRPRPARPVVV
jgi:hypothetical protein